METLQRTANRGSISTGYDIDNSLKLERANSEAIIATNSTQSGNRKTWTFSTWIKRTEISYNGAFGVNALFYAASSGMQINSSDKIVISLYASAGLTGSFTTSQVFRDTSAWYHIVLTVDTTESTSTNRVKLWINGQQVTNFDTATYPNLNDEFNFGEAQSAAPIRIGNAYWGTSPFSAYIAETHYLNGTAKQASDFGEYDADSGIWIPKEYTDGGYGDIGFYYKYDNASSLGEDSSGEGHDASSLNNITSADQATDTPTNNFATWLCNGQLFSTTSTLNISFNEGGTNAIGNSGTGWVYAYSSQAVSSGKWYYEGIVGSSKNCMIGACPVSTTARTTQFYLGQESNSTVGFQYSDGNIFFYTGYTTWESGGLATGDIVGFAMDLDNGKAYVSRNGVWFDSANPATNYRGLTVSAMTLEPYMFAMARYNPNQDNPFNFGGYTTISISSPASDENGYGNFEYAPPSGFYALCSKNLAEYG